MTFWGVILLLIIAAVCGMIAQSITGYSLGGCLASIAIGFIGAIIGQWLARISGLPPLYIIRIQGQPFPVVWAILGSILFVLVVGLLTRRRRVW